MNVSLKKLNIMATKNKKITLGNFKASEKFGDNIVEGAICLDVLDQKNVQALIYEYEGKKYLNLKIVKRKEVNEYGKTHYVEIDQFVPKSKGE